MKNGFAQYTYFTPYLDTALSYGGRYVFAVYFEKDPSTYWEWRNEQIIPPERITHTKKYSFKVLQFNKSRAEEMHRAQLISENSSKVVCPKCSGYGELRVEKYKYRHVFEIGGGAFKSRKDPIVMCDQCSGHGVIGE